MSTRSFSHLLRRAAIAALIGGVLFVLTQMIAGAPTITSRLTAQFTERGGWDPGIAAVMAWAVHLAVSLMYAALYLFLSRRLPAGPGTSTLLVAALGYLTALIAPPATATMIGVVTGSGLPGQLPPLSPGANLRLLVHLEFFLVCWLAGGVGRKG